MIRYPRAWLCAIYGSLAVGFGALAADAGWVSRSFYAWAGMACIFVAVAYAMDRPEVFGKRPDGTVSYLFALPVLPVLLVHRAIWLAASKWTSERAFDEVAPGLIVGRRIMVDQLPDAVDFVLDLTCEFAEQRAVRERGTYRLLRTLDGVCPPRHSEHRSVLEQAASHVGVVYVHCAFGHGRAVAAGAAIMVMRGHASDVDDAFEKIRKVRPRISPSGSHHAFVTRVTLNAPS